MSGLEAVFFVSQALTTTHHVSPGRSIALRPRRADGRQDDPTRPPMVPVLT